MVFKSNNTDKLETLAHQLSADPDYRVLRRVPPIASQTAPYSPPGGRLAMILDVETTGLNPAIDTIIELAFLLVVLTKEGEPLGHVGPYSFLEQPLLPLDPAIIKLTGLTDNDLIGQKLNTDFIRMTVEQCDIIIAHNAHFDAAFVEARIPECAGAAWACSCNDINWSGMGYEGRQLGFLLMQHNLFHDAHRATGDVWATYHLLRQKGPDGRPHFAELLENSDRETLRVEARHAAYRHKDTLRMRGYRWDSALKVWWREVTVEDFDAEQAFLQSECCCWPEVRRITARERHR